MIAAGKRLRRSLRHNLSAQQSQKIAAGQDCGGRLRHNLFRITKPKDCGGLRRLLRNCRRKQSFGTKYSTGDRKQTGRPATMIT